MEVSQVFGFVAAVVVLFLVPGPSMAFVIAQGITRGRRAGIVAASGMGTGSAIHTTLAALGLSALLKAAPYALDVIKVVGAIFLLYLAFDSLRAARSADTSRPEPVGRGTTLRRTYLSAIANNLSNPKMILFFIAFVPQFITTNGWPSSAQIVVLGALLIVVGLAMEGALGFAAGAFSERLLARPRFEQWLKRVSAAVFGGLAIRLLLTEAT